MISMRYSCFIGALISSSSYHQVSTSSNWKEIHWRSSVVFLLHPNTRLSCIHFLALMSSPTILAKSYYFTNLDFSEICGFPFQNATFWGKSVVWGSIFWKVRISPRIPRNGVHPSNTQTAIAPNPPWSMDLDSNPPTCCILPCGNVETREKTLYPEPGNNANISHQTETQENHRLKTAWGKGILVSSQEDRCMYVCMYEFWYNITLQFF